MDRKPWRAAVHGVAKSQTRLSDWTELNWILNYHIILDLLLELLFKWIKMHWNGEFNSDDHYIYYCGQESLRRNGVAIMVKKRVWNAVLGCNLKNDRMISLHFQGKPFNITVIQVYALTSNAEEAEVEQFYEDLQDLLELTLKKMSFSI